MDARVSDEMRANTYDAATARVTLSTERAEAIRQVARHYDGLFGTRRRRWPRCASSTR